MRLAASIWRPGDHFCIFPPAKISYVFLAHVHGLCVTLGAAAITRFILMHLSVDLASATDIETKRVNIYLERGLDPAVELFLTFNCLILNFSKSRGNCGSSDRIKLPWVLMAPMQQGHTSLIKVFGIKICHKPKSVSSPQFWPSGHIGIQVPPSHISADASQSWPTPPTIRAPSTQCDPENTFFWWDNYITKPLHKLELFAFAQKPPCT